MFTIMRKVSGLEGGQKGWREAGEGGTIIDLVPGRGIIIIIVIIANYCYYDCLGDGKAIGRGGDVINILSWGGLSPRCWWATSVRPAQQRLAEHCVNSAHVEDVSPSAWHASSRPHGAPGSSLLAAAPAGRNGCRKTFRPRGPHPRGRCG